MIPTISELRDQILADIQSALGVPAPLMPRAVFRVIASALAGVLHLLYRYAAWTRSQIFTATAELDALVARAAEYGITRTPATAWRGTATVTGVNGTQIPAGTLYFAGESTYDVESLAEISAGTATLTLEALEPGEAAHLSVGDTLTISTPIAGLDAEATVATVTTAGEDAEPIEDFRARIAARQRNVPQGGAIPDWILWATEMPGIAEAYITRPAAGFVYIYPLLETTDPAERIPDAAKLAEVKTYVSDPRRAPIRAAGIEVLAATELEYDVDIANLSPNNAALRAAIEAAVRAYLYARRPKQYSDEADPRDVVSAGEITAEAIAAGAKIATVTLKTSAGTPVTSQTLAAGELAKLRTLSWV